MDTIEVSTHLSRHSVSLNAHQSEKLSMADLILFAQTSASMHFARGSLHYAAVVDIRKILENCPPDVKEAIAKRFQQYQEDALGYDPSAALFLERRKTAVLREQNVTLQAKVAAMQALIGSSGTSFHRLPQISGLY